MDGYAGELRTSEMCNISTYLTLRGSEFQKVCEATEKALVPTLRTTK